MKRINIISWLFWGETLLFSRVSVFHSLRHAHAAGVLVTLQQLHFLAFSLQLFFTSQILNSGRRRPLRSAFSSMKRPLCLPGCVRVCVWERIREKEACYSSMVPPFFWRSLPISLLQLMFSSLCLSCPLSAFFLPSKVFSCVVPSTSPLTFISLEELMSLIASPAESFVRTLD